MKQKMEGEEVLEIASSAIQQEMELLDIGVHDLWVTEERVTFSESYTYQFNQEKLKNIESARLQVSIGDLSYFNSLRNYTSRQQWRN